MMVEGEDIERITLEQTLGKEPARPDTPEEAEFRAAVSKDIAEIKAKGWVVDIPFDP
jgi:hypothetical protein